MKILQIIPHYLPAYQYGGPIHSVHNLSRAMVDKGVDVTVWTTDLGLKDRDDIPSGKEVFIDGVKVYYFPIIGSFHYSLSLTLMNYMNDKISNFDIVHIQGVYQFHSLIGGYFARKYRVPYVLTPRGMLTQGSVNRKGRLKKKIYISLVERKNIEKANFVHCTTKNEKKELINLGLNPNKIVVIPNGVKLSENEGFSKDESFRKEYKLLGKTIILFLGRLSWVKGLDLLIPAFAKIVSHYPNVHLILAGPDSRGYRRKIEAWIRKNEIEEYVTFTGLITGKEKLEALKESDIFVLSSYSEGFGMAAAEAMFAGLPVIVTRKVGIWEIIQENGCGKIIDLNPESIAQGISYLIENTEERIKLGNRARETAKREFSIQLVAEKMIQAYEFVVESRQS